MAKTWINLTCIEPGKRWNFREWHDFAGESFRESIFFWDDEKENTGVVHFDPGVHVSRIHRTIKKLVEDTAFREANSKAIRFPR